MLNVTSSVTGHGLQIMAYRARLIGAVLNVSGAKGEGTAVTCRLRTVRSGAAGAESRGKDSTPTQASGHKKTRRLGNKRLRSPEE
jgi:hypothetical protein